MTYNKTTWKTGDVITEDKLNNIENGIEATSSAVDVITTDITQMQQEINDLKNKPTSSITMKLSLNNANIKNSINSISTSTEVA